MKTKAISPEELQRRTRIARILHGSQGRTRTWRGDLWLGAPSNVSQARRRRIARRVA